MWVDPQPRDRVVWFRRLALLGAALAASVVVLGAWVRLTDAGLGCPDWPGCYGHLYPQTSYAAGKAWHEMIHRYVATALGIIIVVLLAWAFSKRKDRDQALIPVALLFLIVCLQGALGALTVTLLLRPLIVTAHLLGGLTTLGLLWWLSLEPERRGLSAAESGLRKYAVAACVVLGTQIFLGGWTSTNYAALACPDFPTCRQSWWPAMDFRDAFVLGRGLGINYEGGVLGGPARTAIHVVHRLGAVIAGSALIGLGILTVTRARSARLFWAGLYVIAAVLLQIAIGIATVHFGVPLPIATLHNAGAALLVLAMIWLVRALWPGAPVSMVPFGHGNRPR
jgi:cytochrome c oxidase assembly protein subunit 15